MYNFEFVAIFLLVPFFFVFFFWGGGGGGGGLRVFRGWGLVEVGGFQT